MAPPTPRSRTRTGDPIRTLARNLGQASILALAAGPGLAYTKVLPPFAGFLVFASSGLLALLSILAAFVSALPRSKSSQEKVRLSPRALAPTLAPAAATLAILGFAVRGTGTHPRINDITTDPIQPPRFEEVRTSHGNEGRSLEYPGEEFASQQRAAYPEILPKKLALAPDAAFERARQLAETTRNWSVARADAKARVIEGTATSPVFRFPEDFVIEIRPAEGGSEVHMRSRSRYGRGDLGANARRIREFLERI